MTTIGVTGGIGTGKTTVCRMLAQRGARVFYADEQARRLMAEDPELRGLIRRAFGDGSYRADGSLDRAYLAERVFSDPEAVSTINALVHPRVADAFRAEKVSAKKDGVAVLVKEAALLLLAGGTADLDGVVVVTAPMAVRLARVQLRDSVEADAVRARMAHQMSQEDMAARANYLISNDGSLLALEAQVSMLWQTLSAAS